MVNIKITGVKEIDSKLASLDRKLAKRTLRRAEKEVLKPILRETKADAPVATGQLQSAYKIRAGARSRVFLDTEVQVKQADAYYSAMVEFGHDIRNKKGGPTLGRVEGSHHQEKAYQRHADTGREDLLNAVWKELKKLER